MVTADQAYPGRDTRAATTPSGPDALAVGAATEVTTFVGRADNGVEVTVGVRPEPGAGHTVVLLDVGASAGEATTGVRLGPGEAYRLAAALSAAACAAAGHTCEGTAPASPATPGPTRPESDTDLTEITAVEGTPAAELSAAIARLPPGSMLVDFGADADVSLFFGPPAAVENVARTWPASA